MKIQKVKSAQTKSQVKAQVKATPGTVKRVNKTPKRQRGNAILFTLLALVIGGVIISVGITQYQDAERSVRIQNTISEVNTMIGTAKQNFGQYGFSGLTMAVAVSSRVVPQELVVGAAAGAAKNKFGGDLSLAEVLNTGTAVLTYKAVPVEVCLGIVNGTQGIASVVQVNGQAVKAVGQALNVGTLNTQCNVATGLVDIAWTFGRI
jgi:hypothetical protein